MISPESLAAFAPEKTEPAVPEALGSSSGRGISKSPDTLRAYLESCGVKVKAVKNGTGESVVLLLDGCPMNPDHGHDSSTAVVWRPTSIGFRCQHNSCAGYSWRHIRAMIDPSHARPANFSIDPASNGKPTVILPGGPIPITKAAQQLVELLAPRRQHFVRGNAVVRVIQNSPSPPRLEVVRPAELASTFEDVAILMKTGRGGTVVAATCSEQNAKLIMCSRPFCDGLPPIRVVSACPVLVRQGSELVTVVGYDRPSGVLAFGESPHEVTIEESVALLSELLSDFRFTTEADRSRAIAALITPALVAGGLLGGRAPIDLGEADASQSGKGYRNKLTAALYGCKVSVVTQRKQGVGGLEESFDDAVIRGASFISLDNLRGKMDSPRIESFLTEDTYLARVPYSGNIEIDPSRFNLMLTSNKAEITTDLANRSSIVRIIKQPEGYAFKAYAEGDLLAHVRANQSRNIGAVFSVIRAWHAAGMPRLPVTNHDFRAWAGALGWIIENIFHAAPLLDGHHEMQSRVTSPGLNWLRDVAFAVRRANRLGSPLRANDILTILERFEVEIPGVGEVDDLALDAIRERAFRAIGAKLGRLTSPDSPTCVDQFAVERVDTLDNAGRSQRSYMFSLRNRCSPSTPEVPPE